VCLKTALFFIGSVGIRCVLWLLLIHFVCIFTRHGKEEIAY
jgi:hypothetical protein